MKCTFCRTHIWECNREGLRKRRIWRAWQLWVVRPCLQLDNSHMIFQGFQTFISHVLIALLYSVGTYLESEAIPTSIGFLKSTNALFSSTKWRWHAKLTPNCKLPIYVSQPLMRNLSIFEGLVFQANLARDFPEHFVDESLEIKGSGSNLATLSLDTYN